MAPASSPALRPSRMRTRPLKLEDRAEWLRMLLALYPGSRVAEHQADVEAYLQGRSDDMPAAVFVCDGGMGGTGPIGPIGLIGPASAHPPIRPCAHPPIRPLANAYTGAGFRSPKPRWCQ